MMSLILENRNDMQIEHEQTPEKRKKQERNKTKAREKQDKSTRETRQKQERNKTEAREKKAQIEEPDSFYSPRIYSSIVF